MSPLLLTLLPFLLGPAITLLVVLYFFRVRARVARGEPAIKVPGKAAIRGFAFLAVTLLSLWFGFVGAAIIGAVAPQAVMFAADMACPGGVKHDSFDYSYKPGQRGTSQVFRCELPGQAPKEITGLTFVYAGLSFSAAVLVLLLLSWAFVKPLLARFWRRFRNGSTSSMSGPPGSGAGGSVSDLLASVLAAARTGTRTSTTMFVNGQRVNLGAGDQDAVRHTVAEAFDEQPQRPQTERSLSERLKALEELYRAGTINRDEYDAARARLLSEI